MMSLRKALKAAGMTQAEFARSLGVTDGAINHWVTGKRPIPEGRIDAMEALLSVDLRQQMVDYANLLSQGRTPIGYAILWPVRDPLVKASGVNTEPRSEEDFKRRIVLWARELGVTRGELEQAILGNGLLPLAAVERIGELAAHVRNPVILAVQVGFEEREAVAVYNALKEMFDGGAETFTEVFRALSQAKIAHQEAGLHANVEKAADVLDNGADVDDIQWWLNGEPAPVQFEQAVPRDLGGRWKL